MARNNSNNDNNQKGSMSVKQAGEKGGNKTAETHDSKFYSDIGKEGGKNSHRNDDNS